MGRRLSGGGFAGGASGLMRWYVNYRDNNGDHLDTYASPELAIDAACRLIDAGREVYGIGMGPPDVSINDETIARIYSLWTREKFLFGRRSD